MAFQSRSSIVDSEPYTFRRTENASHLFTSVTDFAQMASLRVLAKRMPVFIELGRRQQCAKSLRGQSIDKDLFF
jgi:hypothetical protein